MICNLLNYLFINHFYENKYIIATIENMELIGEKTMKTKGFIIWLLIACCMPIQGQTSVEDYLPFCQENKKWEIRIGVFKENVFGHRIDGDTLICGETWKKVYTYFEVPQVGYSYYAALRDVEKKVYAISKGSNRPRLLYDFGMKVGDIARCGAEGNSFYCLLEKGEQPDTLFGFKCETYLRLERIDTIETFGLKLRRFNLSLLDVFKKKIVNNVVWIEGVGSCLNPFTPWVPLPSRDELFFYKWCKIGNTYISKENDFYDNNETNSTSNTTLRGEKNEPIYNLQGQRMSQPPTSIYIKGGKKYLK